MNMFGQAFTLDKKGINNLTEAELRGSDFVNKWKRITTALCGLEYTVLEANDIHHGLPAEVIIMQTNLKSGIRATLKQDFYGQLQAENIQFYRSSYYYMSVEFGQNV